MGFNFAKIPQMTAEQKAAAEKKTAEAIASTAAALPAALAKMDNLPALTGSEKQVAWAEDIRTAFLKGEDGRFFVQRAGEFLAEVEKGTIDAQGWALVYRGILRRGLVMLGEDAHAIIDAR